MAISRDQALALYRCILDREPESENALLSMMASDSFSAARKAMMTSPEFQRQVAPPPVYRPKAAPAPTKHTTLCVCAIMKNEALLVGDMLRSILPLADFILLHDTGSVDGTPEIAEDVLSKSSVSFEIGHVKFIDFANARNTLIDSVPGYVDWILMMDCDERIVSEDHQLLVDLLKGHCSGWRLPRYNFIDENFMQPPMHYPDFQARLFRHNAIAPVRYAGAVHEVPTNAGSFRAAPTNTMSLNGDAGGPHIHHLGHVVRSASEADAKAALYDTIARNAAR